MFRGKTEFNTYAEMVVLCYLYIGHKNKYEISSTIEG